MGERYEVVSALSCPGLTKIRRNGNTTRQINFAIEALFTGKAVHLIDHWCQRTEDKGAKDCANKHILAELKKRLGSEFPEVKLIPVTGTPHLYIIKYKEKDECTIHSREQDS